jgi:hypothetical protein
METKTSIEDLCAAASGSHPIGLGHVATVDFEVVPADSAPLSGAEWSDERDWPGVSVTLSLPISDASWGGKIIHHDLSVRHNPEAPRVLGARLDGCWGAHDDTDGTMWRREVVRGASMRVALVAAQRLADEALATVRQIVAARVKRLAQREATVANAMET